MAGIPPNTNIILGQEPGQYKNVPTRLYFSIQGENLKIEVFQETINADNHRVGTSIVPIVWN